MSTIERGVLQGMAIEILSKELAEMMEQSEIDYMVDRMVAIQERQGNPMGIEIMKFGEATALYSKAMPWPQFNTVKGFGINELPFLDKIIDFYQSKGSKLQFEITPTQANKELLKTLHERSFYQSGFHATLYGRPAPVNALQDAGTCQTSISIRELKEDEMNLYAEIHCLGTGLPVTGKGHVADNNIVLFNRKGWKFFIGFVDDIPAGVGVMYMKDGLASLTFATTLHEYRNKGVQKALLERRISEACSNHCTVVISQAQYVSTSFRNMERAGMKLGYTRATWVKE
jgi:GNAT superfamily N-acetyltransferase